MVPPQSPEIGGTPSAAGANPTARPSSSTTVLVGLVAKAGVWGLGGRAVVLLANFLSTPFTIRLLGASFYGVWAVLQTVVSWAVLADVGMASASTKFATDAHSRNDDRAEATIIWTALAITGVLTGALAAVAAIETPALVSGLLHLHGSISGPVVVALRVTCAIFVLQAVTGTVNTPQVVRLRWSGYTLVTSGAAVVAAIGVPLGVFLFAGGIVTAASVAAGSAALGALGNFLLAIRIQPATRRPRVSRDALRKLLGYGGGLTLSTIATILLTSAARIFLAENHSTTQVAYYVVAATAGTTLSLLAVQLSQPLLPALTRLEAEGRNEEHRSLYATALSGIFLLITPVTILFAPVARSFLSIWAGPQYAAHGTDPLLVILIGVVANSLGWIPTTYLLSSGRTRTLAYIQLAQLLPYLVATWFLTAELGPLGAAIAWSGRLVVQVALLFYVIRRLAPQLPAIPLSRRRLPCAAAILWLGLATLAATVAFPNTLVRVAVIAVLGTVYAVLSWTAVLTATERHGIARLLPGALKSRPPLSRVSP
jgi:O-antigen/teichoic acid export membrane protein